MTEKQKYLLGLFGFLSVGLLFLGAGLVDNGKITPNTYLPIQAVALFVGLFVLAGVIEKFLDRGLEEFKVSAIWWAGLLAALGYFSRMSALEEVNKIFHVDPAALPMTVIAASAMTVFSWLKIPFIVVSCLSLLILLVMIFGSYFDDKTSDAQKFASGFLTFSNFLCCLLAALFIIFQLDDVGRAQKLYRTAQAADFVSEFRCKELAAEKLSVLFIGPEQRRVLVAPQLPPPALFSPQKTEFLQPLEIPLEFPVVECTPSTDLKQWLADVKSKNPG